MSTGVGAIRVVGGKQVRLGGAAIGTVMPPGGEQLLLIVHDQDAGALYFRVNDALDNPAWQRCCVTGPTGGSGGLFF